MRIGTVIGRVTLNRAVPALEGGRFLIVNPLTREQLHPDAPKPPGLSKEFSLIAYDELGGILRQTVGVVEGREAAQPFAQPTPVDAYCAALIDEVFYSPFDK